MADERGSPDRGGQEEAGRGAGDQSPPAAQVQALALGGSLALSYAAAAAGAWATNRSLDDWYSALKKPSWTPPGAVIGAIWTVLYTLMGLSLWLGWRRVATADDSGGPAGAPDGAPEQTPNLPAAGAPGPAPPALHPALAWFAIQLGLNVLWSFAFFAARSTVAGLAVIVALWVAVAGWVRMVGRIDPLAGRLQLPYLGWVSFAGVLNATIWWRNRGPG